MCSSAKQHVTLDLFLINRGLNSPTTASSKSLLGTPFFEAQASFSPFLNGDAVLVLEPATYYKGSKAESTTSAIQFPLGVVEHHMHLSGYSEEDDSASDSSDDVEELAPTVSANSKLFCRVCRADTCHNITTTTCGHLFCYE